MDDADDQHICPYSKQYPAPSCATAIVRCKTDGVYWLQPPKEGSGVAAFQAFCDEEGWMKILHAPGQNQHLYVLTCRRLRDGGAELLCECVNFSSHYSPPA